MSAFASFAAGAGALGLSGCDQGKQHDEITSGPPVRVSGANVGPNRLFPADGAIKIQFDRMLSPATTFRQGITLVDASGNTLNPVISYDPVARLIAMTPQSGMPWLTVGQSYLVLIRAPQSVNDASVLRAIDQAPMWSDDPNLEIGFRVGDPTGAGPVEPVADFCRDVAPVFQQRCSASSCHGARTAGGDATRFGDGESSPAAGLILQTSAGVQHAIGRVANGSNTGARAVAQEASRTFGVDMPIIDPGFPERSWLMYKMLLAAPSDPSTPAAVLGRCDGKGFLTPLGGFVAPGLETPADDFERSILSDYILGNQMPYPSLSAAGPTNDNPALTLEELERVRVWITQGAVLTGECVCAQ